MRTRTIKTDIIEDEWYVSLQADEKLFFLHLLINPRSEMSGIYYYPDRNMLIDNPEITKERLAIIKKKLEKEGKVYFKDGWLWMPNFVKNNNFNTKYHKKGVAAQLNELQKRHWDVYDYFIKRGMDVIMMDYLGFFDSSHKGELV